MLSLVGVVVAPISVIATLPIVLEVPVLKTTATTSMVGACAHGFGDPVGPTGTLVECCASRSVICYHCGKQGHMVKDCHVRIRS